MKQYKCLHLLVLSVLLSISVGQAFNFVYVSGDETSPDGQYIPWAATDSIQGDMYTNDCFYCSGDAPYVIGSVYMSCGQSQCDFGNMPIHTNVPPYQFADYSQSVREGANQQGHYFSGGLFNPIQYVAAIRGNWLKVYNGPEGAPFDSLTWQQLIISFSGSNRIFFDGPLRISGELNADGVHLTIGSSRDIWIDDNIVLAGTDLETAELPINAGSRIALVAEGSIFIRNTWANGRANSAQGSDVVVTAVLISESEEAGLCLDQPNDPDDAYICPCTPDLRGTFRLNGALIQKRRGLWYTENNGGTGYQAVLKFDQRLRNWGITGQDEVLLSIEPDTLNFSEVPLGGSQEMTLTIRDNSQFIYSGAYCSYPFSAPSSYQWTDSVVIPVTFTPPYAAAFSGYISLFLNGAYHEIPLRGAGVPPPTTQAFAASAYPNPFNSATSLSLNLPVAGDLQVTLYDILGREVERLSFDHLPAGNQLVKLDMSHLSSGVYFANLQAGGSIHNVKLLLMK
jgi:hypothetical protein